MYNNIQTFKNKVFGEIKVLMVDGEPHFPATDCAELLGYANPKYAIRSHCKGVRKILTPTAGGNQRKNFIPEGDLYRLITHSKLPNAKKFEIWLFEKVLPSIRKHGAYIEPDILEKIRKNPKFAEELIQKLRDEENKNKALGRQIDELKPKANFCDDVLDCRNLLPVTVIAKDYAMTAPAFNRLLHDLGVQFKVGGTWQLYSKFADNGYTKVRTYPVTEDEAAVHTYWTFAGQKFLYELLKYYGITPSYGYNADDDIPYSL